MLSFGDDESAAWKGVVGSCCDTDAVDLTNDARVRVPFHTCVDI